MGNETRQVLMHIELFAWVPNVADDKLPGWGSNRRRLHANQTLSRGYRRWHELQCSTKVMYTYTLLQMYLIEFKPSAPLIKQRVEQCYDLYQNVVNKNVKIRHRLDIL